MMLAPTLSSFLLGNHRQDRDYGIGCAYEKKRGEVQKMLQLQFRMQKKEVSESLHRKLKKSPSIQRNFLIIYYYVTLSLGQPPI